MIVGKHRKLIGKALSRNCAAHLLAPHVAEPSFMGVRIGAEQVCGDGMLQKRISQHLQPLQVEAVTGIGQSQGLQYETWVGPQVLGGVSHGGALLVLVG